jgi:hypothetical protein
MSEKKRQMCPIFPDMPCPKGEEASHECAIRVNGEFDPMLYFRDQLVLHCALNRTKKPDSANIETNGADANGG